MKLLITMGQADMSLEHHIKPIIAVSEIEEIFIIRDKAGPALDKVTYIFPPKWSIKFPILKTILKFALLFRTAAREKPILIHGYLLFPYGIMSYLVGKLNGIKIGLSLIAGPVELFMPFGGSPIGKYAYKSTLPRISGINRILLYITQNMDFITTTGSFTQKFLISNKVSKHKIFIIPHIVDDRFMPLNAEKKYDVIYIGRLAKVKHVETFVRAIAKARVSLPYIRAAIVGDGPEKKYLRLLSKELGLDENLHFAGYQSDVWNWYNEAKISVLTSEREGFPYSVMESLSCGVPVITTNCGDVTDIVKNGYNGVIIEDYTQHQLLSEAIVKMLIDPKTLREYSERASYIKNINPTVTKRWIKVFSLLNNGHNPISQ